MSALNTPNTMKAYFISDQDFKIFLNALISKNSVIAPVAKKHKFVFEKLKDADQCRLDYDVTILPPKKEIFPARQELVRFDGSQYEGCVRPEEKILFGVHFYDVKAIDMLDYLFTENNKDINYLANRNSITLVASNVQTVSERAFWGSVAKHVRPKGHDALITKLPDGKGYLFETFTPKGEKLIEVAADKFADKFSEASNADITAAQKVNDEIMDKCPEKLAHSSEEIAKKVRDHFDKEKFWQEHAEDCFSCGSCNTICPTCYCFDVQDNWNLDQTSGIRTRTWDGCLTEDFAKVSLGAGATENFRENRAERFRHRLMRKASYLNEKLGGPACVGCGRCSSACTADIADPVKLINKIMEV